MSGIFKNVARYIFIFVVTLLSCIALLLLVGKIPQNAIKENSRISAEYLSQEEAFPLLFGRFLNSRGDNYADSNLLNVIYNVDSEHAFSSLIEAPYYRVEGESALDNYYETVVLGQKPNSEYSRYWHGSQIFIRPLLTVMSVEGIRLAMFGLLVILNLWLVVCLLRQKQFYAAGIYVSGLVLTGFWMTAFSLEYIMSFLVMTAACIAVAYICKNDSMAEAVQNRRLTCLFIVSGAITCFLDFLTTETLTFTIPVLLYLFLCKSRECLGNFRQELYRMIKWGIAWLFSYASMFAAKWGLILLVSGRTAFENALQSAALRMDGSISAEGLSAGEAGFLGQQLSGALLRNLACLFPVTSDISGPEVLMLTFGVLAVVGALFYLFRKDPVDVRFIGLLALVAVVPYVRFLGLSNHSYIHYFFAYRAQMASVMALLGILLFSVRPVIGAGTNKSTVNKRLRQKASTKR